MQLSETQFKWNICGHQNIIEFLKSSIDKDKIGQSYLFHGMNGLGKYATAKQFAKAVLCSNKKDLPCGNCFSCKQAEKGTHFDLFEIKREIDEKSGKLKKDVSIDQIRSLISRIQQGSLLGGYKIAIVNDAQFLNVNSANTLLKTLEEPSLKTVIILVTDEVSKIPKTVASRCQTIKFLPVSSNNIHNYLLKRELEPEKAKYFSRIACGIPGKALRLLDSSESLENYQNNIKSFFKIIRSPLYERLMGIREFFFAVEDRENFVNLLNNFSSVARDAMLSINFNEKLIANYGIIGQELESDRNMEFKKIELLMSRINEAKKNLNSNINSKSILENIIINL